MSQLLAHSSLLRWEERIIVEFRQECRGGHLAEHSLLPLMPDQFNILSKEFEASPIMLSP